MSDNKKLHSALKRRVAKTAWKETYWFTLLRRECQTASNTRAAYLENRWWHWHDKHAEAVEALEKFEASLPPEERLFPNPGCV